MFLVSILRLERSSFHHGGSVFLLYLVGLGSIKCLFQSPDLGLQFICRANLANLRIGELVLNYMTNHPPGASKGFGDLCGEI